MGLLDDLIINLEILEKVPQGGKVTKSKDDILIQQEGQSLITSLLRSFYGDSRHTTVTALNKLIEHCHEMSQLMMDSHYLIPKSTPTHHDHQQFKRLISDLTNLSNHLKRSINGIRNLAVTYKGEAEMVSRLNNIETKINGLVETIEERVEKATSHRNSDNDLNIGYS